jgi:hypothetical protein
MAGTVYDTTTLAAAIMGDDAIETNRKGATRTLRKFLRTDFAARELQTPGKGGRYAIEMTKPQLRAMTKRFAEWEIKQEEERKARAEALSAANAPKPAETPEEPIADTTPETDIEDTEPEGPTDEEIAAMLSDGDENFDEGHSAQGYEFDTNKD